MKVKEAIKQELAGILADMSIRDIQPEIQHPVSSEHGDYSTNIAMVLGKKLGKNPMELAEQIASNLKSQNANLKSIEKIEVVKPGFINFWLSKEELFGSLQQTSNGAIKQLHSDSLSGKRIMVEYAHPNTHKEMHIGHMRTLITGEALSRLFEFVGAKVFRANYQGDIGPHVAKALYGAQKLMEEKSLSLEEVKK
jgi:arginyl-tRNA synthetase